MADPTPWIAAEAPSDTPRRHAPATVRNRDAIGEVLGTVLPPNGTVLEVASGSGEHCAHFAQRFPELIWQPSDPEPAARASIAAWCEGLANVRRALDLDAASPDWPIAAAAAVLCINMVHISPWEATLGLLSGAARVLEPGAPLFLYGPYRRADRPTAASNEAFDASLKTRDPRWGLRELEEVIAAADGFVPTASLRCLPITCRSCCGEHSRRELAATVATARDRPDLRAAAGTRMRMLTDLPPGLLGALVHIGWVIRKRGRGEHAIGRRRSMPATESPLATTPSLRLTRNNLCLLAPGSCYPAPLRRSPNRAAILACSGPFAEWPVLGAPRSLADIRSSNGCGGQDP